MKQNSMQDSDEKRLYVAPTTYIHGLCASSSMLAFSNTPVNNSNVTTVTADSQTDGGTLQNSTSSTISLGWQDNGAASYQ
ncbi:MAG: hypothetical protein HUK02_03345 [Bacteroidaceae bacterium]|nr:hypothetical protein [Bacteroidaceae bacterium]